MASSVEQIETDIRAAVMPGFRNSLVARGEARSIIWREGALPDDAPNFSPLLSYDLLSYGYGLLGLGLRLRELGGDNDLARVAFEHAGGAIEAVILKGDRAECASRRRKYFPDRTLTRAPYPAAPKSTRSRPTRFAPLRAGH